MKTKIALSLLAVCLAPLFSHAESTGDKKPRIEVCFVLDTTGSMGGLIEGAKQKIWSIANDLMNAKPAPDLKMGLIGYRDRGDEYVVKSFDLTDDIDDIYGHLKEFKADGGGDTPESVNEALADAVNKMDWSKDDGVLKIIFLVGDAPPHMDYKDDVKYSSTCKVAVKKDIIINTVQCGSIEDTTPIWKEIARLSEGTYAAIPQNGGVTVVATPMDDKLADLSKKMGETLIPYGNAGARGDVMEKQKNADSAAAPATAARLSYNAKTGKSVQGKGELLDELKSGSVKEEKINKDELPPELQKMSKEELAAYIAQKQKERDDLQKQINDLSKKRDDYIAAENKRLAAEGKGDSFDNKVSETIRSEGAKKGINYGK